MKHLCGRIVLPRSGETAQQADRRRLSRMRSLCPTSRLPRLRAGAGHHCLGNHAGACLHLKKCGDRGRTAADNRWFVEAVLWIGRTGSPWRDSPSQFGRWHTVYMRFSRWHRKGIWERVAHVVSGGAEIDHVMIDPTIVRAHQHSAGARKQHSPQAIGRSRGDLTTKLHLAIDAAGRPLRLVITEGQVADIVCASELIDDLPAKAVIADKGYDADTLVQAIRAAGAKAVIPPCHRLQKPILLDRMCSGQAAE